MRDISNKVKEFKMSFGEYKDAYLNEIPNSYLVWYTSTDWISKWHKMIIDTYLDGYNDESNLDCERDWDDWDPLDHVIPSKFS